MEAFSHSPRACKKELLSAAVKVSFLAQNSLQCGFIHFLWGLFGMTGVLKALGYFV